MKIISIGNGDYINNGFPKGGFSPWQVKDSVGKQQRLKL